ncbi:hypothetical protein NCC49_004749 [Naganishia albida]|nr:hypothetical protein NCC49_004749 [Naganishia albida]
MSKPIQYIRDVITLKSDSPFWATVKAGDTLRLIARQVSLPETIDCRGVSLEIIAETFSVAAGVAINNQGHGGADGSPGANGANGKAPDDKHGKDGAAAIDAGDATHGGSVKITVNHLVASGEWKVQVDGGKGGDGKKGGDGGHGALTRVKWTKFFGIFIELANGGSGGKGSAPGAGGNGGVAEIARVKSTRLDGNGTAIPNTNGDPILVISGGNAGVPGLGGAAGKGAGYEILPRPHGEPEPLPPDVETVGGDPGRRGLDAQKVADGKLGVGEIKTLSDEGFWSLIAASSFCIEWAQYRHSVGEYFFRCYIPGSADRESYLGITRSQFLGMAIDEFRAALRLIPSRVSSEGRLQQMRVSDQGRLEQIQNNMNPVGQSRDLDVTPDFDRYITASTAASDLIAYIRGTGIDLMLTSMEESTFQELFVVESQATKDREDEARSKAVISTEKEEAIAAAKEELNKIVDMVQKQMIVVQEQLRKEEKEKSVSFGDIVGNVGDLTTAVIAIAAAAPTAGASLVALAPQFIELTGTVYDNLGPLVQAIVNDEETEALATVKSQFGALKKDFDVVADAGGKVVDMVKLIDKISNVKATPSFNPVLGELLLKGAELAYEVLLKDQELLITRMETKAWMQKAEAEKALKGLQDDAAKQTGLKVEITARAGFTLIEATRSKIDNILRFAFLAQRSLEIYVPDAKDQYIYYDLGHVHPDKEAEYLDDTAQAASLVAAYARSATNLLPVLDMRSAYIAYFTNNKLRTWTKGFSFTSENSPDIFNAFRKTLSATFTVNVKDLADKRYEAKIQLIDIAFIGARGDVDIVNCKLEHGAVYWERRKRDGEVHDTILTAHYAYLAATTEKTTRDSFRINLAPLDEPRGMNLFGRPIGGVYILSVSKEEVEKAHLNFDDLREIQVIFGYSFLE